MMDEEEEDHAVKEDSAVKEDHDVEEGAGATN